MIKADANYLLAAFLNTLGVFNLRKAVIKILIVIVVLAAGSGGLLLWQQHQSPARQSTEKASPLVHKKTQIKKNVNLIALGDSLTQGVGDQKKNGGYVGIIKSKIERNYNTTVHTSNYGVAGDRSDQILSRLKSEKNFQSKLKSADVIVMTVGGNDLMQSLQKNIFVANQSEFTRNMNQANQKYVTKLTKLFKAVRHYNPQAPIFLFSVYNPFYVYFANVDTITASVNSWNQVTKEKMDNYGPSYFVDINNLMSHGQYTTKKAQQQLIKQDKQANTGATSQKQAIKVMSEKNHNLNDYISTDDNFHPNHLGYIKMSDQLFKTMQHHISWIREGNE